MQHRFGIVEKQLSEAIQKQVEQEAKIKDMQARYEKDVQDIEQEKDDKVNEQMVVNKKLADDLEAARKALRDSKEESKKMAEKVEEAEHKRDQAQKCYDVFREDMIKEGKKKDSELKSLKKELEKLQKAKPRGKKASKAVEAVEVAEKEMQTDEQIVNEQPVVEQSVK